VATHAGITVGPDGASHQAVEDIAILRAIPSIKIVSPCDGPETREAILAAFETKGPFYIRLGRSKILTLDHKPVFKLGEGQILKEGSDVTIVACGMMVQEALKAQEELADAHISARVINMPTIKPVDEALLIASARRTKGLVVCEEHSVIGGLGSAVAEVLSENYPTKILRVGVKNRFGQSGEEKDLLREYQLTASDIVAAAKKLL
jgi:transketolase